MKIEKKQGLRNIVVRDTKTKKVLENVNLFLPNIQSVSGFLKGEWDLSFFDGCFNGTNRLGDIDGSVEIDGHHLAVEFKESIKAMNNGQLLKAIRMAKYCNTTTVFVFGRTNKATHKIVVEPTNPAGKLEETDMADLKVEFRRWCKMAKTTPMASDIDLQDEWEMSSSLLGELRNAK